MKSFCHCVDQVFYTLKYLLKIRQYTVIIQIKCLYLLHDHVHKCIKNQMSCFISIIIFFIIMSQALDDVLESALNVALKSGYRHIDTAVAYKNEHVIGKVINEWISSGKVTRDELFIVTKVYDQRLELGIPNTDCYCWT
jgi:predicted aldo/keto reductase-like oxidoreductase